MQRALRSIGIVLAVLLVLTLILGGAWLGVSRRAYPKTSGTVTVDGLTHPVEIYRDEYGVPHIYAQTSEDLFFAQGYVHSQDRFWQMEFWRRIGAGRLSEYFGSGTLSQDIYLRTVGFEEVAQQEYDAMDDESRALMEAYSAGVNAYTQNRTPEQLGLEFALLKMQGIDIQIEPWTPIHTLTWGKAMAQDLSGNMSGEMRMLRQIRAVGVDMAADLNPPMRQDFPVIVPDEEIEKMELPDIEAELTPDTVTMLAALDAAWVGGYDPSTPLAFGTGQGIGSNNWVISGDLTTTGTPLLANDPHLGIRMPSIWYEVALHCVNSDGTVGRTESCPYEVRGFSFAGVPGVVIGHNDRIAWGVTNVGPDVQDLYLERLNPENPDQYEVNGEWVDMELRREEIIVKGQPEPVVVMVRSTRHGPIVTDNVYPSMATYGIDAGSDSSGLQVGALALRWTALEPGSLFRSVLLYNRASNWDEFREALTYFDVPSQNFVYADVDGNIGYQMPGNVPIRAAGDGSIPVPGWTDDYEWTGYIPFDELPRAYNPEQGYIQTANQNVVSDAYPYLLGTDFAAGYRGQRINEMIRTDEDGISIEDIQAIQGDNLNIAALDIIPLMRDLEFDDSAVAAARDRLEAWDGQMHMDSPEAALYALFWAELVNRTFNDQLPSDSLVTFGEGTYEVVYYLIDEPDNAWWDYRGTEDEVETRDDIIAMALERGYAKGVEQYGANLDDWRWGELHPSIFRNETIGRSGIELIESIWNRGPVATSGGSGMVNATSWSSSTPFEVSSVPSMRQIIDLGDLANSLMIHTTGQSGHPGHPHYDDFIEMWRLIQYHPTLWNRDAVEDNARQPLTLNPNN